ncbi:MAG: dihydroneopterin aldolase [Nevskia sp.]|nr:dihydroneopterin aldolase [Nevskia sp.]
MTSGDSILIEGLQVRTIIGVHAWEQHQPRPLLLDLELGIDLRNAAASDRLRDAVDYKAVADELIAFAAAREFRLLETLAESIARLLFERHPILWLRLAIGKPGAVPEARNVAVRIERRREDYAVCGR